MRLSTVTVLLLVAPGPALAQGIGTWSASRSPDPIATSPHYQELRARIRHDFPRSRLVALHTLSTAVLSELDAVMLDGQGATAPTAAELEALVAFARGGGLVVADGVGPTGTAIAHAFEVTSFDADGDALHTDAVPAAVGAGPFGAVSTFTSRRPGHLETSAAGAVCVGDRGGARLVSLPVGAGHVLIHASAAAFADPDLPGGRFADNAPLMSNWIADSMPEPRVGTWSTTRSSVGFGGADAFDVARAELETTMPGMSFVPLDRLDGPALDMLDVVMLDSTAKPPLDQAELDALQAFVGSGGAVVGQVYGTAGAPIADLFGLQVGATADAAVRTWEVVSAPAGPFGSVARFQNRYEATIAVGAGGIPLAGDAQGARVVYVPAASGRGAALLLTNLFAWGDPDWSVGGLAKAENDNVVLLGNFLAEAVAHGARVPPAAPPPAPKAPAWQSAYQSASLTAVQGDPGPLQAWLDQYRVDPQATVAVDRTVAWLAAPPSEVDPRFFPVDGILLGTTTRKEVLAAGHDRNTLSKWTFDVGPLQWMCLEARQDYCYEVRTSGVLPSAWSALGLATDVTPEKLVQQLETFGYKAQIGVANVSPFGRQVVARGFGVLWQADYTPRDKGETLLAISARRVSR